jgi:hypothetical protein
LSPFVNPLEAMMGKREEYEEVDGEFACANNTCYTFAKVGRYYRKEKRLEWTCPNRHVSEIENYDID